MPGKPPAASRGVELSSAIAPGKSPRLLKAPPVQFARVFFWDGARIWPYRSEFSPAYPVGGFDSAARNRGRRGLRSGGGAAWMSHAQGATSGRYSTHQVSDC